MTEIIRTCLYFNACGKREIYNGKKWQEHWHHHKNGGYLCERHYLSIIRYPLVTKEGRRKTYLSLSKENIKKWRKAYTSKRITFLGKRVSLSFEPRTGHCSLCTNNIYDKSCKETNLHHYFYMSIMMWACTIEKCASCHTRDHNLSK